MTFDKEELLKTTREELKDRLTDAYFQFSKTEKPEFKTLQEAEVWRRHHNYIAESMVTTWVDNTMVVLEHALTQAYQQGAMEAEEKIINKLHEIYYKVEGDDSRCEINELIDQIKEKKEIEVVNKIADGLNLKGVEKSIFTDHFTEKSDIKGINSLSPKESKGK